MQYIIRYDVKPKSAEAYRTWLADNAEQIRDHARPGWAYLGTWFTVQGFGSYGTETRWELDDYAALGTEFDDVGAQLMGEWLDFLDDARPVETYLMKSAEDVIIMEGT